MAFPAMISAIPAYLLMRDLGLLNTFFALVLPGAANGMAIFMLKGFFDSLPPELYEAATIDGAKEWQIFLIITLVQFIVITKGAERVAEETFVGDLRHHLGHVLIYLGSPKASNAQVVDRALEQGGLARARAAHQVQREHASLVRGLHRELDPGVARVPVLPEDHPARHHPAADEVAGERRRKAVRISAGWFVQILSTPA